MNQFSNNKYKTWVEIDRSVLVSNIRQFKKIISPRVKFCAVVKSNAYGHGLVEVAKICQENKADWLGIDSIDEAIALKNAEIKLPILILGYTLKSRLAEAVANGFRLTVYNKETIEELGKIRNSKFEINPTQPPLTIRGGEEGLQNPKFKINIHIKVETGTSRQGVLEKDILDFVKLIKKYPQINIEGISTHYANIEDTTDHTYAMAQLERFKKIVAKLEEKGINIPMKHTACSAATILFPQTYFDMVRVGISLYGLWPSKETKVSANLYGGGKIKLQPAICWKTKVAQIKDLPVGTPISYGLIEKLSRDSKVAVLPIGYWDGYDRGLSSFGNVLISGRRCKILGRVCMNMMVVDVTDVPKVKIEDEAVLLGKQGKEEITIDEIAQKLGTINYEVVTRINPQIKRVVK